MTSQGLLIRINEKTRLFDCYPNSKSLNPTELIAELKEEKGNLRYFCDSKGNPLKEKVAFLHSDEEAEKRQNFIRDMVEMNNRLQMEKSNKEEELEKVKTSLSSMKESNDNLRYAISMQTDQLQQKEKKLSASKEEIQDIKSDYRNTIEKLGTSQESLEDLKKLTLQITEQNKELREQNKELKETNKLLRTQNDYVHQRLTIGEIPFSFERRLTTIFNNLNGSNVRWGEAVYNNERFKKALNFAITGNPDHDFYFPTLKIKAVAHPEELASDEQIDACSFLSGQEKKDLKYQKEQIYSPDFETRITQEWNRQSI